MIRRMTSFIARYGNVTVNDPKMLFVYGEIDPWTAAAPEDYLFYNKKNMHKFVKPGGSHSTRINNMPEQQREQAWAILQSWLEE